MTVGNSIIPDSSVMNSSISTFHQRQFVSVTNNAVVQVEDNESIQLSNFTVKDTVVQNDEPVAKNDEPVAKNDFIVDSIQKINLSKDFESSFVHKKAKLFTLNDLVDDKDILSYYKTSEIDFDFLIQNNLLTILSCLIRKYKISNLRTLVECNEEIISRLFDLFINDGDVLIILTRSFDFILVLKILYKKLLIEYKDDKITSVLFMKLIWRHSKQIKEDSVMVVKLISLIDESLFCIYREILVESSSTVLKVCMVHIKEICLYYSTNSFNFHSSNIFKGVLKLLLNNSKYFDIEEVREIIKLSK